MYRCCVNFYLMGWGPETAALLKGIPPLEHFSHTFTASPRPEASLAAQADVILADLQAMDAAEALQALTAAQKEGAQLIAVAGGGQEGDSKPGGRRGTSGRGAWEDMWNLNNNLFKRGRL